MRKTVVRLFVELSAVSCIAIVAGCGRHEDVGAEEWRRFVNGLTDPQRIAYFDVPNSKIATSFDPLGGNDDFNHYVQKGPKGWWVLADLEGPGYVSRFWMTGPPAEGTYRVRLYFDGERKPRIDASLAEFFGMQEQNCWFSYLPLTYSRRLVIMTQEGATRPGGWPRIFFQINYSSLPKDQVIASFPRKLTPEDRVFIEDLQKRCKGEGTFGRNRGKITYNVTNQLSTGETVVCKPIAGPARIRRLRITPDLSAISSVVGRERVLRDVILRIAWDDSEVASVEVPLGDFFGSMWRRTRFNSLYVGMTNNTFETRFPMPFRSQARISFENQGKETVKLKVEAQVEPVEEWNDNWGYFHACWRRTSPRDVGMPHPIISAEGVGKYVGCVLSVTSQDKSWWILEGDETIRIDNEIMPGWKGTGLEDYFNGGWYYQNALARPLYGLLFKAPFRTIQYRFHLNDPVCFHKSIDMRFERGPNQASKGWMESVAYYYMQKPIKALSKLGSAKSRKPPPDPFSQVTIMTELINQERLGDYRGAGDHIDEFLEEHPDFQFSPTLRLRQIAYEERMLGFDRVRGKYQKFIDSCESKSAVAQAKYLLWYHENSNHALLGVYCSARTKVFIDGRQAMEVDHPQEMFVKPVALPPGKHVLAFEAQWTRQPPWVQICLRTHQGNVITASDWRWSRDRKSDWKSVSFDDSSWPEYGCTGTKGPPEVPFVRLMPNAFVGMQSEAIGIRADAWNTKKDTVFFRKTFEIGLLR